MSTIQIKNVTKTFGSVVALDNVSVDFKENTIYGLLGRNGAGKSTLLNIVSNRLFPTSGEIIVDGEVATENDNALGKIYCMSDINLYPDSLKIDKIFVMVKQYYPNFDMNYALELAKMFNLNLKKKTKSLSTGYSSIYKIIIALSCNAEIVFLDEPVLGLDAPHRELFYKELVKKYSSHPSTYVISTHLIEEASSIIEKVVIIKDGKVIADEDTAELISKGYAITGSIVAVDEYCKDKKILGSDALGGLKTAYIFGKCDKSNVPSGLKLSKIDLQKLFIELTSM